MFKAAVVAVCVFAAVPLGASGFVIDQTARASGVAGAYVAQTNDATAVFYNPGALGILTKKKGISAGAATSSYRSYNFQGRNPGIAAGTIGEQSTSLDVVPAAFLTAPFKGPVVFGLGAYYSMRMNNEWQDPQTFSGRFLATKSNIEAYDIAPTFGLALSPTFGIGGGAVYRTAKVTLERNLSSTVGGTTYDIASQSIESDTQSKTGWQAGMAWRPSEAFMFGLSYRSAISVEFEGAGTLTQIQTTDAQLNELVRATFPFDQNLAVLSQLRTPAQWNAGIAFAAGEPLLFEIDVNRTEWKRMEQFVFIFPNNPSLTTTYPLNLEDTLDYRAGMRFTFPTGPVVRLGYSIENSPQPDETISPFYAAMAKNTITAGFGLDWLDVAVGWSTFDERSVTTSVNQFNGDYSGNQWTVVVTATK
jgi:long-chain fatty acid transport protein